MPHIVIEYSPNLESLVDMGELCENLRLEAAQIDAFPSAGIRVRAIAAQHYSIADGDPKHGFVDMSVRIRQGRPDTVKKDAIDRMFGVLKSFFAPVMASRPVALSAELRDIDAELSPKFGNIREHLGVKK